MPSGNRDERQLFSRLLVRNGSAYSGREPRKQSFGSVLAPASAPRRCCDKALSARSGHLNFDSKADMCRHRSSAWSTAPTSSTPPYYHGGSRRMERAGESSSPTSAGSPCPPQRRDATLLLYPVGKSDCFQRETLIEVSVWFARPLLPNTHS